MNIMTNLFTKMLLKNDVWVVWAMIVTISIGHFSGSDWWSYLTALAKHSLIALPMLIFKWQNKTWKEAKLLAVGVFLAYPLAVGICLLVFLKQEVNAVQSIISLLILIPALEVFSEFFHTKQNNKNPLFSKWSLQRTILLVMAVLSLYLAMLIVSDLSSWARANSVAESIHFEKLVDNLGIWMWLSLQLFLLFFIGYIFFWLNSRYLVPLVLVKKGIVKYLIACIASVCLLYPVLIELYLLLPINYMGEPIIPAVEANAFDWANGRVLLAVLLVSMPFIVISAWHEDNRKLTIKEKEHSQTELQLLKQQIDPHFFFNTLNNLYSLTLNKSEKAPEVLLQLSEIMRYVVYVGKEEKVPIQEDINYLKDYIDLQSIRFHHNTHINMTTELECSDLSISPLLLVIFVENAFKHGLEQNTDKRYLDIHISEKKGELRFKCVNSIEPELQQTKINEGVGISNLRRRLALIYPHRHQLTFSLEDNVFIAELTIDLNDQERLGDE